MRKGKRLLAGIAAGGLAAGLISFTGAGAANAAAPSVFTPVANTPAGLQVVRSDDATYSSSLIANVQAGIQATATGAGSDSVEVFYQATPNVMPVLLSDAFAPPASTSLDLSGDNTVILTTSGGATFGEAVNPDAYQVTAAGAGNVLLLKVFRDADPGKYTLRIWSGATSTGYLESSLWVSNSPSYSDWTPDVDIIDPGETAQFNVMVFDAAGRPTYLKGAERLNITSSNYGQAPVSTPVLQYLGSADINQNNAVTVWGGAINVTSVTDVTTARGTYELTASPNGTLQAEGLTVATTGTIEVRRPEVDVIGWPAASRAQQRQYVVAEGVFPNNGAAADWTYNICAVPATVPFAFDPGVYVTANPLAEDAIYLELQDDWDFDPDTYDTIPGSYAVAVYYRADDSDPCAEDGRPQDSDSIALTPSQWLTFGGPIATLSQSPATAAMGVGNTQTITVTAKDAAGRVTLPTPWDEGDSISYWSVNDSIASVSNPPYTPDNACEDIDPGAGIVRAVCPSYADLNDGVLSYVVTANSPGTTTVYTASVNAAVADADTTIGVQQSGAFTAASTVFLQQPNVIEVTDPASLTARYFEANTNVDNLVFKAAGLVPGQSYAWSVQGNLGNSTTASPTSGIVTADASGNASATVAVNCSIVFGCPQDVYTFTLTSGTGATRSATVEYVAGVPLFASPANNGIFFAAAGSTVSVPVVASDQYGNPIGGATVTITSAAGTQVAQGVTNSSGQASLSVTAPATGTASFILTGLTPLNYLIFPNQPIQPLPLVFTVDTRTPVLTSLGASPSSVLVPVIDSVVDTGVEATTVQMRVNTPDGFPAAGVTVAFSGSEGVKFSTSSPTADAAGGVPVRWNGGAATVSATTNAAGIATVYAWTTKTGSNTVTAKVSTVTATATFTAGNTTSSGRTIEVKAPESMTTAEIGVVTLTVKDAFGNVVPAATPVTVQFNDGSIGTFANGSRQMTVQPDAAGQAQVTVISGEAGDLKFKSGVFVNSSTVLDQFGAAANQLFRNSAANSAPGFAASNAPLETTIKVSVAKAMAILQASRDARTGAGLFNGVASGFAADAKLNVRVKVWNEGNGSWSKWRAGGQVALSNVVDSAGNRSFAGVVTIGNGKALKVRVTKDGINSESVTIPGR